MAFLLAPPSRPVPSSRSAASSRSIPASRQVSSSRPIPSSRRKPGSILTSAFIAKGNMDPGFRRDDGDWVRRFPALPWMAEA
ncbi:hypothetical protein FQY83_13960 [Luteimonas marina]|uniref:Uncharacterized protein n=1 Tax=Luteimonas marina TaxID=488485 RepID=A0A5C5TW76_9GAMM|nr:hypothetical protein [Luteimonas marina]TWT18481.1 hypothetical protein FQY83_13960 [Luteimonas marina]